MLGGYQQRHTFRNRTSRTRVVSNWIRDVNFLLNLRDGDNFFYRFVFGKLVFKSIFSDFLKRLVFFFIETECEFVLIIFPKLSEYGNRYLGVPVFRNIFLLDGCPPDEQDRPRPRFCHFVPLLYRYIGPNWYLVSHRLRENRLKPISEHNTYHWFTVCHV